MGIDICAVSLLLTWIFAPNAPSPRADYRQDALPEWVLQLSRVRNHLKENFKRIPNYVCQESVERFERKAGQSQVRRADSLHFEVARVQNKELLALPGAAGFEDRDLTTYMSSGVLGTGMFSTLPLNLFVANGARVTLHQEGAEPHAGQGYDYEIPAFLGGGIKIATDRARATVGVRGTFWVDAGSLDLIRIEEHAVDVPPQVGMTQIDSTVDYARMRIGDSSVLLPQSAELAVTNLDGSEQRNKIEFSGCREYVSESTVRFGDPTELPPVEKTTPASQAGSDYRGQRVRLSAWVKTKNAGRANLWMRVDGANSKVLAFDNLPNRPESGTLGWHRQEIVLLVPQRAVLIAFGLSLEGHGQAWLYDVSLETAGKQGGTSGQPIAGSPSGAQKAETQKQIAAKPRHPVNLNFEQ